jgi:hypothetical protein
MTLVLDQNTTGTKAQIIGRKVCFLIVYFGMCIIGIILLVDMITPSVTKTNILFKTNKFTKNKTNIKQSWLLE